MRTKLGFTVIEIIISIAVISIISATLLPTIGWLVTKSHSNKTNQQAGILLMEGAEVAYNVLQSSWDILPGVYHPAVGVSIDGRPVWQLVDGGEQDLETRFDRTITISDVCRDVGTGAELACGAASERDVNSKRIVTEVTWIESGQEKRLEASLLIANLN